MENLIPYTLASSTFLFIAFSLAFLVMLIVAYFEESIPIAFWSFVIFMLVNSIWGTLPVKSIITLKSVSIYIAIGFIYSIIRTYLLGKKLTPSEKLKFKLKERIFNWWFMFPISLTIWIFGDLLKQLYNFVYNKIENFYMKIFNF